MKSMFTVAAVALASLVASDVRAADSTDAVAAFRDYSGARLVFRARDLPRGGYFDVMRELPAGRRAAAARIALAEVKKYPPGYLGKMGLDAIGIFDGLAAKKGDGYRPYDKDLGGYRYYGLWNGSDALVAAYYSDGQLPLTLHHEIFHHVDATAAGRTDYGGELTADDAGFAAAIAGKRRYPALALDAAGRKALTARAQGYRLTGAVSAYAAKNPGEDQAETARHLMTALPDALLQMAKEPTLAGSQRMLHVLAQYQKAVPDGPAADWFVDVALGRTAARERQRLARTAAAHHRSFRDRVVRDGDFVVWGREDSRGINWTLRRDLWGVGRRARALVSSAAAVAGGAGAIGPDSARTLRLLARYHQHIAGRWQISAGTQQYFDWARDQLIAGIADDGLRDRLKGAGYADLTRVIDAHRRGLAAPPLDNEYLAKVDAAIADRATRAAIRRVQPATVRLDNGSGVNLTADGVILTAGHVSPALGRKKSVLFPDGRRFLATTFAYDRDLDIALLKIDGSVSGLPAAPLAARPPVVGTTAICIGQPGRHTPDGEETGYQPFHVSVGRIRGVAGNPLASQSLGGTKHDAWTYWGHSGSPIFDEGGRIIAMHNSWDSTTAMRHAVTWQALMKLLRANRVAFSSR